MKTQAQTQTQGIVVVRPEDKNERTVQSRGIRRLAAVAPETTGATRLWMGTATTPGGTVSAWHHHGDCETGIYVVRGHARFRWGPGGHEQAEVGPGDFLAVAPHAVHQEEALGEEEFVMVVARSCSGVLSVDMEGPEPDCAGSVPAAVR